MTHIVMVTNKDEELCINMRGVTITDLTTLKLRISTVGECCETACNATRDPWFPVARREAMKKCSTRPCSSDNVSLETFTIEYDATSNDGCVYCFELDDLLLTKDDGRYKAMLMINDENCGEFDIDLVTKPIEMSVVR